MCDTDEFDELELEAIVTAHLSEDDECDERQIDEYGDYRLAAHPCHNAGGGGCLTIIAIGLLFAVGLLLLIPAA